MAMVVRVKPEYNGKIAVQSSNSYNGIILSNDLSQATLVQIYNTEDELRDFLYTTYTTVGDSYAPSQIDPSLIHAYASEEITHNPAKTDYPANTVGKHLNETRGKIDSFDNAFVRPSLRPIFFVDFSNGRFLDPRVSFARNSKATYIDRSGVLKEAKANQIRIHYDPMTLECLGFIPEGYRQNLIPDSMLINNWQKSNATYDGPTTLLGWPAHAFTLTSGSTAYVLRNINVTPGTTYSFHYLSNIPTTANIRLSSSSRSIQAVSENIANGVWLHAWTFTPVAGETSVTLHVGRVDSLNAKFIVTAPQLEIGDSYSSYIPTTSGIGTREADLCSITGIEFTRIFPSIKKGTVVIGARKSKVSMGCHLTLSGTNTAGGVNRIEAISNNSTNYGAITLKTDGQTVASVTTNTLPKDFSMALAFETNSSIGAIEGSLGVRSTQCEIPVFDTLQIGGAVQPNTPIKFIAIWNTQLNENEIKVISNRALLTGRSNSSLPANSDLGSAAFLSPFAILRSKSRQEFSVDGTGASVTRNIRRDYDFDFEIVDSSGVTITAQPASSCTAGTDNALTFTAPLGKTLTYAITPVYEN